MNIWLLWGWDLWLLCYAVVSLSPELGLGEGADSSCLTTENSTKGARVKS